MRKANGTIQPRVEMPGDVMFPNAIMALDVERQWLELQKRDLERFLHMSVGDLVEEFQNWRQGKGGERIFQNIQRIAESHEAEDYTPTQLLNKLTTQIESIENEIKMLMSYRRGFPVTAPDNSPVVETDYSEECEDCGIEEAEEAKYPKSYAPKLAKRDL